MLIQIHLWRKFNTDKEKNEKDKEEHVGEGKDGVELQIAESKVYFPSTSVLPEIDRFYLDDTFVQWEEDIRVKQPNTVLFCKLLVRTAVEHSFVCQFFIMLYFR